MVNGLPENSPLAWGGISDFKRFPSFYLARHNKKA
jgi:hypothetical protein